MEQGMDATIVSLVNQLIEQIKLYRIRIPKQTGPAASAARQTCSQILTELPYGKPRAFIRALYLDDTSIHDLTIDIMAEILRLPDGLARTMLIHLLMEVPAELYHPHLAIRLDRRPPQHLLSRSTPTLESGRDGVLPSGSPPAQYATLAERARSMVTARRFLRGLLVQSQSETGS